MDIAMTSVHCRQPPAARASGKRTHAAGARRIRVSNVVDLSAAGSSGLRLNDRLATGSGAAQLSGRCRTRTEDLRLVRWVS